jgi:dehydrogenase/reductase SDR family protein 12
VSRLAEVVDAALEWSVAGSFTHLGYAARRRLEHWAAPGRIDGRVVVLTGATSGLGRYAALALAERGAQLVLVGRNQERLDDVVRACLATPTVGGVRGVRGDLGEPADVRALAAEISAAHPRVHVLIHNAGALDDAYATNSRGVEGTVASQVLGPHLLTTLLRPQLAAGAPSRVLWVSSGGMYAEALSLDALEMPRRAYDGVVAYARAKRAQIVLSELWAERLRADGIASHALHPGWADTPGVARALPRFRKLLGAALRDAAAGADTLLWLACTDADQLGSGQFWHDRRPRAVHRLGKTRAADTPAERARLWAWVDERAGVVARDANGLPSGPGSGT